jgi:hypothetical protein
MCKYFFLMTASKMTIAGICTDGFSDKRRSTYLLDDREVTVSFWERAAGSGIGGSELSVGVHVDGD